MTKFASNDGHTSSTQLRLPKLCASFIIGNNNQGDCVSSKGMLWWCKAFWSKTLSFCHGTDPTLVVIQKCLP